MSASIAWQPSCELPALQLRAHLLQTIRQFFAKRGVLEVETPLLSQTIGTNPQLNFFNCEYAAPPFKEIYYLQTSPEFAMKRLLAAGSGSVYQVCKAFRNGESGRFHNPEFTLLEWYRVNFDLADLMAEVEELFEEIFRGDLKLQASRRISYPELFSNITGLDCLVFDFEKYASYATNNQLSEAIKLCDNDHATWLDFIFSHKIQPGLGHDHLCLVYDYPACQSSLARTNSLNPNLVERVELFLKGVELGNGYFELTDFAEQTQRFNEEIAYRQKHELPKVNPDSRLLAALKAGLPECAGMAIGVDRVLMLLARQDHINAILPFSFARA